MKAPVGPGLDQPIPELVRPRRHVRFRNRQELTIFCTHVAQHKTATHDFGSKPQTLCKTGVEASYLAQTTALFGCAIPKCWLGNYHPQVGTLDKLTTTPRFGSSQLPSWSLDLRFWIRNLRRLIFNTIYLCRWNFQRKNGHRNITSNATHTRHSGS